MPNVTVLMNCYNGEKYLKQALDSVFSQTYRNWQIVFVDNHSSDDSCSIAESYGDKVKLIRTPFHMSLGEARNFGLSKCNSKYVAFLDVDDFWEDDCLSLLVSAIESGQYALAYGGQNNVDPHGTLKSTYIPSYKSGLIFSDLLKQFDIPIVSAIIDIDILRGSGLNFDSNVSGSEEYCLFMQLSVNNCFAVIDKPLVNYRLVAGSLTEKTLSKRAYERRYTLDRIVDSHKGIYKKYSKEFAEAYARGDYYEAQYFCMMGDFRKARNSLLKAAKVRPVYLLLYIISFFPSLWILIQDIKYGRK